MTPTGGHRVLAPMTQKDLAEKKHWDALYGPGTAHQVDAGWQPYSYDSLALAKGLLDVIAKHRPASVLEVGCGNSTWLPYLGRQTGVRVCGIDYSEDGCELARQRLRAEGVAGEVRCLDITKADPAEFGRFDMVFSLGLVEHFTDTEAVLRSLIGFVRPGGVLVTEIPNLKSVHGLMAWVWQPDLLRKHKILSRAELEQHSRNAGLQGISGFYQGLFSLTIVAWELYPRWPKFARIGVPVVSLAARLTSRILRATRCYWGSAWFSPFIFVVGSKPQ
jgi:2-polyprenyl-3-methyl-5-hydroxy-6-metoxy-1,4-benzoquinol methylase